MTIAIAVATDAVIQAVNVVVGLDSKFSITELIEAGLSAGLAKYFQEGLIAKDLMTTLKTASKVALLRQGAELALGIRKNIDFREIVISVAAQAARFQLSTSLPELNKMALQLTHTAVDLGLTAAVMGRVDRIDIARAIGNAIGSIVGSQLSDVMQANAEENWEGQARSAAKTATAEQKKAQVNRSANNYEEDEIEEKSPQPQKTTSRTQTNKKQTTQVDDFYTQGARQNAVTRYGGTVEDTMRGYANKQLDQFRYEDAISEEMSAVAANDVRSAALERSGGTFAGNLRRSANAQMDFFDAQASKTNVVTRVLGRSLHPADSFDTVVNSNALVSDRVESGVALGVDVAAAVATRGKSAVVLKSLPALARTVGFFRGAERLAADSQLRQGIVENLAENQAVSKTSGFMKNMRFFVGAEKVLSRDVALKNLYAEAKKLGVEIRTGSEADAILDHAARMEGVSPKSMHAVTIGDDLILVRNSHATNVRVLREELLHTQQQKVGFEISKASQTQAEIQVREQMISRAPEWGLTTQEIEVMRQEVNTIKLRGGY